MIGNNSCGVHSVMGEFYGPGARRRSRRVARDPHLRRPAHARRRDDRRRARALHRAPAVASARSIAACARLRDRYARPDPRALSAQIPRRVSGYNLDELLPENGLSTSRARSSAAKSTCVTDPRGDAASMPQAAARSLVVLGYPSVYEAGDHVPQIRAFGPIGLEGLDDVLFEDMRKKHIHPRRRRSCCPRARAGCSSSSAATRKDEADAQAQRDDGCAAARSRTRRR